MGLKKYKLLKDLPWAKSGSVYTRENENHSYYNTNGTSWKYRLPIGFMSNEDLFEEIKEDEPVKEFRANLEWETNDGNGRVIMKKHPQGSYLVIEYPPVQFLSSNEWNENLSKHLDNVTKRYSTTQEQPTGAKDWEIVEMVTQVGIKHKWGKGCEHGPYPCKIHSVRRLSDNQLFVVGDKIKDKTIGSFDVVNSTPPFPDRMRISFKEGFGQDISRCPIPEPTPNSDRIVNSAGEEIWRNDDGRYWRTSKYDKKNYEVPICPETGKPCVTGLCMVNTACSIQEVAKHQQTKEGLVPAAMGEGINVEYDSQKGLVLEKERIEVTVSKSPQFGWRIYIESNAQIPQEKFPAIKWAVEAALNNEFSKDVYQAVRILEANQWVCMKHSEYRQLRKQDLINARMDGFNAGRAHKVNQEWNDRTIKFIPLYPTYQDFLNSLENNKK